MNASKLSPDDPRLTAYALGELQGDECAAIEAALAEDPLARAYVEETRRFAAHLQSALVDEPAPSSTDTASAPVSRLHLLPPYEPKSPKLLQFPQLYFVVGGLAAACFALMIVFHEKPSQSAAAGKQYVAVELGKVSPGAASAPVAAAQDADGAPADEGNSAATAAVDAPFAAAKQPSITVPVGEGLLAEPKIPLAGPPVAAVGQNDLPGDESQTVGAVTSPPATPGSAVNSGPDTRKRVVTIVSKRNRATTTRSTPRVAMDLSREAMKPFEAPHLDLAGVAPLPAVALAKTDEQTGGEFVGAAATPIARFSAPNDAGTFAAIAAALKDNRLPDPKSIAIEELLNRGIGGPTGNKMKVADGTVAASGEVGPAPWAPTHRLVRLLVYAGGAPAGSVAALAARDVSMEVEFNPRRVVAYRLIGYERNESAANKPVATKVVAADFRANRAVVALFEVIPAVVSAPDPDDPTYSARHLVSEEAPRPRPEMLTLRVQYRHALTGEREKVATPVEDPGTTFVATTGDFKYSAGVAAYGMILRHSSYRGRATLGDAIAWAEAGVGSGPAAQEREEMLDLMRRTRTVMQARHG